MGQNGDAVNGFADVAENGFFCNGNSVGSSHEGLRTYKRRRHTNMSSSQTKLFGNENIAADTVRQLSDEQKVRESVDTVLHNCSHDVSRCSDDSSLNLSRNIVLKQLNQSLHETEGGFLECVQDKTSVHNCGDNGRSPSLLEKMVNGIHNAGKGHLGGTCNHSSTESNHTKTDLCQRVLSDIMMSEKFAQLRSLLLENFEGVKIESILDISLLTSRMKEGAYEKSPMLFHSDMQQLWMRLQKVGAEMLTLSKSLMDNSKISYSEQFSDVEFDLLTKPEQTEACSVFRVCACRHCGEKADVRECLVCDSCEEMYHVSCIKPAVEEIPLKSWYCINCIANGIESPHDNCVVCEKLNAVVPLNNGVGDSILDSEELSMEFEETSNKIAKHEIEFQKGGNLCKICGSEVDSSEKFKVCGHSLCLHRYYHMKCLTNKQLSTYSSCWYCPSCLCRACLTDQDDHNIVLCDGCDNAYHIYCMEPPRTTIPRGKWFCKKCDAGIQIISKAKRAYEKIQSELKKRGEGGKEGSDEEVVDKAGGVEMLLTAADTLKDEEKMAAIEMKS